MTSTRGCQVCGQEDCGLHHGALAFAHVVDLCALVGAALLACLMAGFAAFW